ncbi:MAG: hypothetical protein KDK72_04225 [Chlamydiia bacterium]|nr:hypothetical protein [Chlamydiia bacterium]
MSKLTLVQFEEEQSEGIFWEKPFFYRNEKQWTPKIFESSFLGQEVPEGFNSVTVAIDGSAGANLDWSAAADAAAQYCSQGLALFWKIDLGLFHKLKLPLDNQTQMLSLKLSLDHFRDTLWQQFHRHTIGISLYEGSLLLSDALPWDDTLKESLNQWGGHLDDFCIHVFVEYLERLACGLPEALQTYVLLDAGAIVDPAHLARLATAERFDQIHLALKESRLPLNDLSWRGGRSPCGYLADQHLPIDDTAATVAVCLPSLEQQGRDGDAAMNGAFSFLEERQVPYRVIPELMLTSEWDGLDYLIVWPQYTTPQGLRMLQGFCAAGGTIVTLGEKMDLPEEITFAEWKEIR